MNKTIVLTLFLLVTVTLFSQDEYVKLPQAKTQNPTYLYNSSIIGSENAVEEFGKSEKELKEYFNELSILKDKQNRKSNTYYNLTEYGMLFVDLKKDISSKTQAELNDFFNLKKQSDIYVDGYLVENKQYKICLTGISEIEIVEPNSKNKLNEKVLNIWTLAKNKRYRNNSE